MHARGSRRRARRTGARGGCLLARLRDVRAVDGRRAVRWLAAAADDGAHRAAPGAAVVVARGGADGARAARPARAREGSRDAADDGRDGALARAALRRPRRAAATPGGLAPR